MNVKTPILFTQQYDSLQLNLLFKSSLLNIDLFHIFNDNGYLNITGNLFDSHLHSLDIRSKDFFFNLSQFPTRFIPSFLAPLSGIISGEYQFNQSTEST